MNAVDLLAPVPVRSPAGHAWSFEATERRLAAVLDRVPITRVYDATALDRLGLPVWAAVTPLAGDLKVHAGKGMSPAAARLSAVMEAVERVSAETVAPERVWRGSFAALRARHGEGALSPERFDLPFQTAYEPGAACSWLAGCDLLADAEVWVALDLVVSPATEGVCRGVETNGLAAGNVAVEAVLHGLYEVIERDAAAVARFRRLYGEGERIHHLRMVALDTLPPDAAAMAMRLREAGVSLTVEELSCDTCVPVYRAALADTVFPGREDEVTLFEGLGADLDAEHAVARAIAEAVQAHTAVLVGARDTFEGAQRPVSSTRRMVEWLAAPSSLAPFRASGPVPTDLGERLRLVLERLRTAGFRRCVVVDLTRPDLGVPVVRVLVAGAAGPYGETARRPPVRLLRALVP